ncbi:hypothetical protein, partial [Muriicola sp.]
MKNKVSSKCRLFKGTSKDVRESPDFKGPVKNSQGEPEKNEKQTLDEKPLSLTFVRLSSNSEAGGCILPKKV